MPTITFIDHAGIARSVLAESGYSLMEVARANDIPGIDADCGGVCACATCHVFIDHNFLDLVGPRSDNEEPLLEFVDEANDRSRLSCQIVVADEMDGMIVNTPESQK